LTELEIKHQEPHLAEILHSTFLHNSLSAQCPSLSSSQTAGGTEDRAHANLVSTIRTIVRNIKQSNRDRSRELGVDYSQFSLSAFKELNLSALLQHRHRQNGSGSGDHEEEQRMSPEGELGDRARCCQDAPDDR
jgi:hypothetical protein